ncbi:glycosyltransferase family 2 protein [Novispirillum itersonii]|uniref:glycosyltransferase family 2 protein n=1 Tax=Novispirillum itersonii TaxID=189 RepID=UPI00039F2710|nr:glycosyltransferase family 2 protein [Novispirillum itersonii]
MAIALDGAVTVASESSGQGPFLSVVVPVYNEGEALHALHSRLTAVLRQMPVSRWEIVLVDDGSRDTSFEVIRDLAAADPAVRGLRFARNFGKEAGMAAGLRAAAGDVVVLMDGDLQHPPELLPEMLQRWTDGAQMVTAVRRSRQTDPTTRRLASRMFYWLFHYVSEVEIPEGAGDFRLFDRAVVDAINSLPERNRFMKGITSWVGFRQVLIDFEPAERVGGQSAWPFLRLFRYALDGISAFSMVPLRVWSIAGVTIALLSVIYGGWLVVRTLIWGIDVPGYASLMVAGLFTSGIQLISLGALGEYIGRIFNEVKGRPLYIVADRVGQDPRSDAKTETRS